MSTTLVTKRDGTIEEFCVDKLKKCINWACEGLQVNPLALEAKFNEFLDEEVTSKSLQEHLINSARMLANAADTDWVFVSGRLWTMNLWKERYGYGMHFEDYLERMILSGEYYGSIVEKLLECYSDGDLEEFDRIIDSDYDLDHSYGSVLTAVNKYLTPNECIQQMHMVNAMCIGTVANEENRLQFVKDLYKVLAQRKLSLATPWLANLRTGGNISSCFIIEPQDSIDSIFDNVKNAALISKKGGGLGISMARIRAEGSNVNGVDNASKGVFGWTRIFNDVALFVDQCFHPDELVTTKRGFKKISELKAGEDEVLTHNGEFKYVDRKLQYTQTEPVTRLKVKHSLRDTLVTNEHPFYALTGIPKGRTLKDQKNLSPSFVDVSNLEVGDFIGQKIPNLVTPTDATEDFMRFYGIMLGDGSISKKRGEYSIALGLNKSDTLEFCREYLSNQGVHYWETFNEEETCIRICWSKRKGSNPRCEKTGQYLGNEQLNMPELLRDDLYSSDSKKRIHERYLNISTDLQLQIIKGLVETDGGLYRDRELHFFTSSDELADQVRYLLLRMRVPCSSTHGLRPANDLVKVDTYMYDIRIPLHGVIAELYDKEPVKVQNWIEHDDFIFSRITEIERGIEYDGDVYDLKIKHVPSYQTHSGMAHNGGKRAGAFTVSVPVWHRDIEGFLEIQSETGESRNKAFDIFPQVTVNDLFMTMDEEDGNLEWYTFCPHEVRESIGIELAENFGKDFEDAYVKCVDAYKQGILTNVKVYAVRDLMKKIMRPQFDTGLPYFNFIDTINADNPNNHEGTIPCGNLCQESFSVVKPDEYAHSCNLASLVVGRCKDLKEVCEIARIATRVLDYGIDLTDNPTKISQNHNERYRTVGVGIQGATDWLAKEGFSYKDHKELGKLMEAVQFGCVSESVSLSKERGAYPAFEGSKWYTGEQFDKYLDNTCGEFDWVSLKRDVVTYGIRNSQLTSPAPNTSTSVFMDAGAGVMPSYGGFYLKDNGNGIFPFSSMYVKENPLSYAKSAAKWEHEHLVNCVSEMQVFTDAGISTEYFFDHNKEGFSAKDLYKLIHYAWKKKTKALYYIRHIKKGKSFTDEVGLSEAVCEGCGG